MQQSRLAILSRHYLTLLDKMLSRFRAQLVTPCLKYKMSKWTEDELFVLFKRKAMASKTLSSLSEEGQIDHGHRLFETILKPELKLQRTGM